MSTELTNEQIMLYDNNIPSLVAGNYQIQVAQNVELAQKQTFSKSQSFTVIAPRFNIDATMIHSVYPKMNAQADFSNNIPHIVFNKSTLPWERQVDSADRAVPWMALLIFKENELLSGMLTASSFDSNVLSYTVTAGTVANQTGPFLGPSLPGLSAADSNQTCKAIVISAATFTALMPTLADMHYTGHVKEVSVYHKPMDASKLYSTILSNRLVTTTTTSQRYIAHLVSIEGFTSYLTSSSPTQANVAMISLASWTFTSVPGSSISFRTLATNLVAGFSGNTDALLLKLPSATSGVDHAPAPFTTTVFTYTGQNYLQLSSSNFTGNAPFTVELWIKASALDATGTNTILSQWQDQTPANSTFNLCALNGIITFIRNVTIATSTIVSDSVSANAALPLNEWHHIAATYDGNMMWLYIDGVEQNGTISTAAPQTCSSPVTIGASYDAANNLSDFFTGQSALLRIWNIARTQADIQQSMGLLLPQKPQNLVSFSFSPSPGNPASAMEQVNPTPTIAQKVAEYLRRGFIARNFETQSGERTFAWYRGPLTPVFRANSSNRTLRLAAVEESIYDPGTGIFDLSYSVAWETGRLLALADKTFATQVMNWRKEGHYLIDLLVERLGNQYITTDAADANNVAALRSLLKDDLVSNTFFKNFITALNTKLSPSAINTAVDPPPPPPPPLPAAPTVLILKNFFARIFSAATAQRVISSVTKRQSLISPTDTLLALKPIQQFLALDPKWTAAYESITVWLARLSLFYDIPFRNLVPAEEMLPKESIRFFYIDQDYLDSLIDGALSVGTVSSKDSLYSMLMRNMITDGIYSAIDRYRDALLGVAHDAPAHPASGGMAGVLIRSAIVSDFPGIEIKAYPNVDATKQPSNPMKLLRYDKLSADVLLCIFPAIPVRISLCEPMESPTFAINADGTVNIKTVGTDNQATVTTNTVNIAPETDSNNVMDLASIAASFKSFFGSASSVSPSAFALQFLKGGDIMDLDVSVTMPIYQYLLPLINSAPTQVLSNSSIVSDFAFTAYRKQQPGTIPFYIYMYQPYTGATGVGSEVYYISQDSSSGSPATNGQYLFNAYPVGATPGIPTQLVPLYQYSLDIGWTVYYYSLSPVTPSILNINGLTVNRTTLCLLPAQEVPVATMQPVPLMQLSAQNNSAQQSFIYEINSGQGEVMCYVSENYTPDLIPVYLFKNESDTMGTDVYHKFSTSSALSYDGYLIDNIAFYAYSPLAAVADTIPVYIFTSVLTTSTGNITLYRYSAVQTAPQGWSNAGVLCYAPDPLIPMYGEVLHNNGGLEVYSLGTAPSTSPSWYNLGNNFCAFRQNSIQGLAPVNIYLAHTSGGLQLYRFGINIPSDELNGYSVMAPWFYAFPRQVPGTVPLYEFAINNGIQNPAFYYYSTERIVSNTLTMSRVACYVSDKNTKMLPQWLYQGNMLNMPFNVCEMGLSPVPISTNGLLLGYGFPGYAQDTVPIYLFAAVIQAPGQPAGLQLYYFSADRNNPPAGYVINWVSFYAYTTVAANRVPVYCFSATQPGNPYTVYYFSISQTPPNSNFSYVGIAFYINSNQTI